MRYLLIDPVAKTVTEGDHAGQITWREIVALLGCSFMCSGGRLPNGDLLWVDDEGLLKPPPIPLFHMPAVNEQPLAFRGLITGPEVATDEEPDGEIVDAKAALAEVQAMVRFEEPAQEVVITTTKQEHPGMVHITLTPEFRR